jgi:tyrosyl-tRNA synthetase
VPAFALFADAGLAKTRGEARRLIAQGGGYVNSRRLEAADEMITLADLKSGSLLLRAGKKKYVRVKPS